MKKRSRLTIAAAAVLAVAAALSFLVASKAADLVEALSRRDVARMLDLNGLDWAEVQADGLQVILIGEAPDEATRFRALRESGKVIDAARLIDQMDIARIDPIQPPHFSVEILRNDDGVKLIGLVPVVTGHVQVAGRIAELAGDGAVADLLDEADFPPPEGWDPALDFGLVALGKLPRSKISITANRVAISAISESLAQKRQLEADLRAATPAGLKVSIEIGAPRPVVTPFTLRFIIDARGPRFDACTTDNETGRDRILAAARRAGLDGASSCTIGLGVPSPQWDRAAVIAIGALADLGGGSVTFSDADVTLKALPGTDAETFDRISARLKSDLPEVFSLETLLPEPPVEDGDDAADTTPRFIATLAEDGSVQLRGAVADERARGAAMSYARALFGATAVSDALRLRDDLPEGWPARVFAALETLSELQIGQVAAGPDEFSISGKTGREDAQADVARILSDKLGTGADFKIDIAYVEALDPTADLPTPEECVDQINAVLNVQKITFAPSSADIDEVARASLDNIAEIMKQCEDVPMEVGGHTDSQGREIMNKELSQARADAVVNALLARRVLTSNLTAVGYGEEKPIADNDSEEGREANRRIEFRLVLPEEAAEAEPAPATEEPPAETAAEPDAAAQSEGDGSE